MTWLDQPNSNAVATVWAERARRKGAGVPWSKMILILAAPSSENDDYGRLGFIITRDKRPDLYSGPELELTKEMFNTQRVLIVKLTAQFLASLLSKLRSTRKPDPCERDLNKLLDTYTRLYLSGAKISGRPPG